MISPTIVVVAYSRPQSLQRLLTSLDRAHYPDSDVKLIISIDTSPVTEVKQVAEDFSWNHGSMEIVTPESHLGLRNHVLKALATVEQEENIILLEDDLLVGQNYYDYAVQALQAYGDEESVAGISLYSYRIAESCFLPFDPVDDGFDNYFIRFPSSWGLAINRTQWSGFDSWRKAGQADSTLPSFVEEWGDNSWKKEMLAYMLATGKLFAFPRNSHSTTFSEIGVNASARNQFQTILSAGRKEYRLSKPGNSQSIYDEYFEPTTRTLHAFCESLRELEVESDLYGVKEVGRITAAKVLTGRRVNTFEQQFGSDLLPPLLNVAHEVKGKSISLCAREELADAPTDSTIWSRASLNGSTSKSSFIIYGDDQAAVETSLKNLNHASEIIATCEQIEAFPSARYSGPVQNRAELNQILSWTSNPYIIFLPAGSKMATTTPQKIESIFKCFRDVDFIIASLQNSSGAKIHESPVLKFTAATFSNTAESRLHEIFGNSIMAMRRELWMKIREKNELAVDSDPFLLTWRYLLNETKCHPAVFMTGSKTSDKTTGTGRKVFYNTVKHGGIFRRLLNSITRPFFLSNTPFLRFPHQELNHYPEVIRENPEGNGWYKDRY